MVEYYYLMLNTEYQNFGAFCFLATIFLMFSLYFNKLLVETVRNVCLNKNDVFHITHFLLDNKADRIKQTTLLKFVAVF